MSFDSQRDVCVAFLPLRAQIEYHYQTAKKQCDKSEPYVALTLNTMVITPLKEQSRRIDAVCEEPSSMLTSDHPRGVLDECINVFNDTIADPCISHIVFSEEATNAGRDETTRWLESTKDRFRKRGFAFDERTLDELLAVRLIPQNIYLLHATLG